MKLRQIVESGYEDLEDNDQFRDSDVQPEQCERCGLVMPQYPEDLAIRQQNYAESQATGDPMITQLPVSKFWDVPELPDRLEYRKAYCPECYEEGWADPRYSFLSGLPSEAPHPSELDQYIRDQDWSEIESYPGESEESIEQNRLRRNKYLGLGDDNRLLP